MYSKPAGDRYAEVNRRMRSSYEQLASTPRHYYSQQMCSVTPSTQHQLHRINISHSFPRQQQCLSQIHLLQSFIVQLYHSQVLWPKKLINNDKALPSGAIEQTLSAADDVIARYPNLKGSKLPTLAISKRSFLRGENNEAVYWTSM